MQNGIKYSFYPFIFPLALAPITKFLYLCTKFIDMVKHIILWTLNESLQGQEKRQVLEEIKSGLESLQGVIPGLVDIRVQIDHIIDTSNCDLMLDCTLESEEALRAYAVHPAHVAVANSKVRPFTIQRVCLDFEV